jgi:hypothetical protein
VKHSKTNKKKKAIEVVVQHAKKEKTSDKKKGEKERFGEASNYFVILV